MTETRRSIPAIIPRAVIGVWAFLLSAAVAARGQDTPLRVVEAGTPYQPHHALVVKFDQPVAPAAWRPGATPRGIKIIPAVAGRYDWPDSMTLRFTPAKPWAEGYYSLTIDSTFSSRDGTHLDRPLNRRFGIGFAQISVWLQPGAGALRGPVVLGFSPPGFPAGSASDHPPHGITLHPSIAGQWLWIDSYQLRLTPSQPFAPTARYTLVVDTSFRGPYGARVPVRREFRLPEPPPPPRPLAVIVWQVPQSPTDPLVLSFNGALAPEGFSQSLLSIEPRVDGTLELVNSVNLRFTPRVGFQPGVRYVARLLHEIRGVSGGRFTPPWEVSFGFWLQLWRYPADLLRLKGPLDFRFSRRIQPLSGDTGGLLPGFRLTPHVPGHVEYPDSQTLRFIPDAPFIPGTRYLMTVGRDFVTPDGWRLADSIPVTIRSGLRGGGAATPTTLLGPLVMSFYPTTPLPSDTRLSRRGFRISPETGGSLWWKDWGGHVEFRPDSVLRPNTEYTLSFDTAFRAPDGTPLLDSFTVRIRTLGPKLAGVWPLGTSVASFVSTSTRFRFVMTQPVHGDAWADSVRMAPAGYYAPGHACRALGGVRFRVAGQRPVRRSDSLFAGLLRDTVGLERAPASLITLVPDRALPDGCPGKVTTPGYQEWPLLPTRVEWPFQTAGVFRLRSARAIPGEPVPARLDYDVGAELAFTNPVSQSELHRHVRISPPLAASFAAARSQFAPPATVWQLQGALAPATTYRVSADSALRDAFGQRLAEPFVFTFSTAPAKPALIFQSTHRTASTRSVPTLDVMTINVSELRVCTARVPDSMRTRMVSGGWWAWNGIDSASSGSTECRLLSVQDSPRDSVRSTIAAPWKPAWRSRAGLYAVRVSSPQVQRPPEAPAMVVFHVTDLAVQARIDRDRGMVLVARRADGKPVPGAVVTVRTCSGETIGSAETDQSGIAELAGMATAEAERSRYACFYESWRLIEVSTPTDGDALNVAMSYDEQGWVGPLPASILIPDRLVYRRGDTIRAQAVVRRPSTDSIRWVVVGKEAVRGEERDGLLRRPVLDTVIRLSRAGTAQFAIPVGARFSPRIYETALLVSRLGRWRQLADAVFWVTDDPVPRTYLSLSPDRRWGAPGDSVSVAVEAWDRDGRPMAGVVRWSLMATRWDWSESVRVPPGFTSGSLNVPPRAASSRTVPDEGALTLGPDGRGQFTFRLPDRAPGWPWRVVVQARIQGNGVTLAGRTAVDLYPADFILAIRADPGVRDRPGAADTVEVFAVRPDGTPVTGVPIQGVMLGRKWSLGPQERDSLPGPAGPWVPDTVDRCSTTTADHAVRCVFNEVPSGWPPMVFSATDSRGHVVETQHQVGFSSGWNGPSRQHDPIALVADRASLLVGDTATLRIENSRPGALVWLTVASGDRLESRVLRLSGNLDTARLPIRSEHVPRVSATVTAWYPESEHESVTRLAETSELDLEVRDPGENLAVTIETPDRAEAASTRRIVIKTDASRDGRDPAEILVWAIDQRLAAADSQRMPDVIEALMRPPPARRVTVSSLRDPATVAYVPVDPGSVIPPSTWDEDPDVLTWGPWGERGLRQLDDLPGPILLGAARAGRDGTATLHVRLPEAAGRYRVIAVALTSSRLGRAEGLITVGARPPLLRRGR